jgi:hypothetical protein
VICKANTARYIKSDVSNLIETSKKKYLEHLHDYNYEYINSLEIDSNSIKLLELPYAKELTHTDIYSLTIFNLGHFEYNLGRIPVLISFDKENQIENTFPYGLLL